MIRQHQSPPPRRRSSISSSQPPNLILRSPRLPPSGNIFERNRLRALDPATEQQRQTESYIGFQILQPHLPPRTARRRPSPRSIDCLRVLDLPRDPDPARKHPPASPQQPAARNPSIALQPPASGPGPASLSPDHLPALALRLPVLRFVLALDPTASHLAAHLAARPPVPPAPPTIARSCHRATPRSPPSNPRASPRAHRCHRCCNTSAPPPHALLYRSFGGAGGLSPAPDPERWSTQNPALQPGSSPSKLLSHPEHGQSPRCCGSSLRSTSCLPSFRRGTMLTPSIKGVLETREMSRTLPKVQPSPAIRARQLVSIFKHTPSLRQIADRSSSRHYLDGRV